MTTHERTCLLVLGMHRSGTSAVARVLNLLGAALPTNVIGATDSNPAGHWEPHSLAFLNRDMLDEAGSRWDDWSRFRSIQLPPNRQTFYRDEIARLIAEDYGDNDLIVIKDPRICRFVDLYQDILTQSQISVKYVLALRHPLAVINSLEARDGMQPGFAARLWLRHVLDAEANTRGLPRSFVWYDELLANPSSEVERLSRELGIVANEASILAAQASLRPDLAHHHVSDADIGDVSALLDSVTAALSAGNDLSPEAISALEWGRAMLNRASAPSRRVTLKPQTDREEELTVSETSPTAPSEKKKTSADIYVFDVDPNSNTAAANVLRLVGANKDVLEIGAGPGSIARPLVKLNKCRVTALEADVNCLPLLREFCEDVYQGNLNDERWHEVFLDRSFDVVVIADVLEHLIDPWTTLKSIRRLLRPGGAVVSSIPNSSHSAMVASLLNENVDYRDWGLLDRTHVRFFGLQNIQQLFRQAGLKIVDARFVTKAPEETEFVDTWFSTPEATRRALESRPFSQVYQTVVKAQDLDETSGTPELVLLDHPPEKRGTPILASSPAVMSMSTRLRTRVGKILGPTGRAAVKRLLGLR